MCWYTIVEMRNIFPQIFNSCKGHIQENDFENSAIFVQISVCCWPSGVETGIFQTKLINTMDVDSLVPCVARPSATMVLNMQDKYTLSSDRNDLNYLNHFSVQKL